LSNKDESFEYYGQTQTLVGQRERRLIDQETGELIQVSQIVKRTYGTKAFWKCYLMDFLQVLGIVNNKQIDVFVYIIENTNPATNMFIGTYDRIAEGAGACRQTISIIMKKLQEHNFIKKVQNGVWLINPDILVKGNDNKRQLLLSYYLEDRPIEEITKVRRSK